MSGFTSVDEEHERSRPRAPGRTRAPAAAATRSGRDRPGGGARHLLVDVAVDQVVERARAAAGEGESDHRGGEAGRRAGRRVLADEHAARTRPQEQRHHPRLGQRHVVAPRRRAQPARRAASRRCPRPRRPGPAQATPTWSQCSAGLGAASATTTAPRAISIRSSARAAIQQTAAGADTRTMRPRPSPPSARGRRGRARGGRHVMMQRAADHDEGRGHGRTDGRQAQPRSRDARPESCGAQH